MKNKQFNKRTNSKNKKSDDIEDEFDIDNYDNRKKWFQEIDDDPKEFPPVTDQILIDLKQEAQQCYSTESAHHNIKNKKSDPNQQWMNLAMNKGTASDKIAAHAISVQNNPVYSLEILRNMVGMVKVAKKKECTSVIDVLTELFLSDLLRFNTKLKSFDQRPLSLLNELSSGNAITRRKLLSVWYFEDQLKEIYSSFVIALNAAAQDSVEYTKEKALTAMYKLLVGNPEQEKNLLSFLINKLGDPSQKVASKAIYNLTQLLFKHPNMQGVVLNEVERLLFRPNISTRAQYYGLCYLSQFYLSHESKDIANRLIQVYFAFFKACIKKGDIDSRMMSALLSGVNRAYPYSELDMNEISDHVNTMYRIVHMATFNISLHALTLLQQVSSNTNSMSDRFYSALYKKLLDPSLLTTTHQAMLLNLIYKSLLNDKETSRVKTFIKRLLQIASYTQPAFACGILYLLSQLIGKKENLQAIILKQSTLNTVDGDDDDDNEEKYYDVKQESDDDMNHETDIKITTEEATEEIKIEKEVEEIKNENESLTLNINNDNKESLKPSWYHCQITVKKLDEEVFGNFNPLHRNPLYAGGEFCTYTELNILRNHFHPTVSLFATKLIEGETIKYSGDCLKDFTLFRFLDRFVFKNPKIIDDSKPNGAHPTFGKRKLYNPKGLKAVPINSNNYLKEKEENIPVDELFMYRYLQSKIGERRIKKEKEEEEDDDLESVGSEEFEDMLDKMSGFKGDGEDDETDLDFLGNFDTSTQKDKKKKKQNGDENDESDEDLEEEEDDDDDDFEDEDGEAEGMEDLDDGEEEDDLDNFDDGDDDDLGEDDDFDDNLSGDDDDDEEMVFDSNSEDDEEMLEKTKKNLKKKFNTKSNDINSLFASAEEFASLLEDEGTSTYVPGSSNVFENKDNAHMKQIKWEDKRNQSMQNYRKRAGKRKRPQEKNNVKKPKFNKPKNKNKKFKK